MRVGKKQVLGTLKADAFTKIAQYEVGSSDGYTKLLAHFDGNDGAKEVVDSGNTGHISSLVNTAQISTAYRKIGNGSLFLDGNSDYITVPDSADWNFGTGDFTIDCWVNRNSLTGNQGIVAQYVSGASFLKFEVTSTAIRFATYVGSWLIDIIASYTFAANTWYHLAVVRKGTTGSDWILFVNGVSQAITLQNGAYDATMPNIAADLLVGANAPVSEMISGYIDELRVSKGIARWTSNFTPQTTPYTSDANTQLLLHCEPTDVCGNQATFVADAQIDTGITDAFGGSAGCLKLDGTGDYVSFPDSTTWDFGGTSPFTIDCWVRPASGTNSQNICGQYVDGNNAWALDVGSTQLSLLCYIGGSWRFLITAPFTPNGTSWYHIAVVRVDNGNTSASWRMYVDGVSQTLTLGAGAWNGSFGTLAADLKVGHNTISGYFNGYIDELRISNVARWTAASFTPETAAYITTATPPATQLDFGGVGAPLDGNTDEEYLVVIRQVGLAAVSNLYMYLNNDKATNYGQQLLYGYSTSIGAYQGTDVGIRLTNYSTLVNTITQAQALIYAKSGYVRTVLTESMERTSGAAITGVNQYGHSWNNTTDNITSIQVGGYTGESMGIGNGSSIELYARKVST